MKINHLYPEVYLDETRWIFATCVEIMMDFLHVPANRVMIFIESSKYSHHFEMSTPFITYHCGSVHAVELLKIADPNKEYPELPRPLIINEESKAYWTGWHLLYYQWRTAMPFDIINQYIPFEEIYNDFNLSEETKDEEFCALMDKLYLERKPKTNINYLMNCAEISSSRLAKDTGIDEKFINDLRNGTIDIADIPASTAFNISNRLHTRIENILEYVYPAKK